MNFPNAGTIASSAATHGGGTVSPVLLWILVIATAAMFVNILGPLAVAIVTDAAQDVAYAVKKRFRG